MNKFRVTFAYGPEYDPHTMQVVVSIKGTKEQAIQIVQSHWRDARWFHVDVLELSKGVINNEE